MPRHATLVEDDAHRVLQLVRGAPTLSKTRCCDKRLARHRHVHSAAARPSPSLALTKTRALLAVYGLRHAPPVPPDKPDAHQLLEGEPSDETRRELLELRRRTYRNHFSGLQATYGPTGRPKLETLIDAAMDAKRASGRHHSTLAVGAAVLTSANRIYSSGRLESAHDAKFDVCAERAALLKVLNHANDKSSETEVVEALVVCSDQRGLLPVPCGACREFLADFGDFPVFLLNADNDSRETRSFELFPLARHTTYTAMATTSVTADDQRTNRQAPGDETPALDARDWTCEQVACWVKDVVALPQYADTFADKRVDGATLWLLADADLQLLLGVVHPLHRRRFLMHLDRLRDRALLDHGLDFEQLSDYVAVLDRDRLDVVAQLKQTFDRLDANRDGLLDAGELTKALQTMGLDGSAAVAAQQLLESMTASESSGGGVSFPVFVQTFSQLAQLPAGETRDAHSSASAVPHVDLEALRGTFDRADANKSGTLDEPELVSLLQSLGRDDCERRAREWFVAVDSDGDARLSFAEFFHRYAQLTRLDLSAVRAAFDAECRGGGGAKQLTAQGLTRGLQKLFPHVDGGDVRAWCARRPWASTSEEGDAEAKTTLSYADFALACVMYGNALRLRVAQLRHLQLTLRNDALCHRSRIVQLQQSGHVRLCRHPGGGGEEEEGAGEVSLGERRRRQIKEETKHVRRRDGDDDGKCGEEDEEEEEERVAATFKRFASRSRVRPSSRSRRHRADSNASDEDGKRQQSDEDDDEGHKLNAVEAAQALLELGVAWSRDQLLRYLDRDGVAVKRTIGRREFTRILKRLQAFQSPPTSGRDRHERELWEAVGRRLHHEKGTAGKGADASGKKKTAPSPASRRDYDAYLRSKNANSKRQETSGCDALRGRRRCREQDLARHERSRKRRESSSSQSDDTRRGRSRRRISSRSRGSSTSTASSSSSTTSNSSERRQRPSGRRHAEPRFRGLVVGDRVTSRKGGAGTLVRLYRDYFVADVRFDSGATAKNVELSELQRLSRKSESGRTDQRLAVGASVRVAYKGTRTASRRGTIQRCRTDGTYDVVANECGVQELLARVPRAQLVLIGKPVVFAVGAYVTVKRRHEYLRGTVTMARTNGTYDVRVRTARGGKSEVVREVAWELLAPDEADEDGGEDDKEEEEEERRRGRRPRDEEDDDGKANDDEDDFEPEFGVGDRVEARFQGQKTYFGGRVTRVHSDGTCDIAYDDGDAESRVRPSLMRAAAARKSDGYDDDFESD